MSTAVLEQSSPETGIVKLSVTDQEVAKLKEDYLGLTINGIEDKAGFKKVYEARQEVKRTRVALQKHAKGLREKAVEWQKKVLKEENRVVSELEAIEAHLQAEEDKIEAEKERIRQEKIEAENKMLQERIDALAAYGFAVDVNLLRSIDDESFQSVLANAKSEYDKEQIRKAEEAAAAEEARIKAEAERKELEELRAKQAEADRILKENQEREEREKLEAKEREEKAALQRLKEKMQPFRELGMIYDPESESLVYNGLTVLVETLLENDTGELYADVKESIDLMKKEAEEKQQAALEAARKEAVAKALAEKEASDKAAKEEADRQAALRPDKEKLEAFANSLGKIINFQVSDPKAQMIVDDIATMIGKMQIHILKKVKEL
jgi:chemotaxis protein histidine kinase CheA